MTFSIVAAFLGAFAGLFLFVLCYWMVEELEFEGDLDAPDGPEPPMFPDWQETRRLVHENRIWAVAFMSCAALSCGILVHRLGISLAAGCGIVFCFSLISLTFIDRQTLNLPDVTTLPTLWLGLAIQLLPATETIGAEKALTACILAYLIPAVPSALYALLRNRSTMGGGDLKMLAMIGAWMGLPAALVILFLSAVLLVIVQIVIGHVREHMHDSYAFGPYLGVLALAFYLAGAIPA